MDTRQNRDSLLKHIFKNWNQHLALQGPPGDQTIRHHLPTSTKLVDNLLGGESIGWTNRKVVHPCRSNRLVDNPEVEETTMNQTFHGTQWNSLYFMPKNSEYNYNNKDDRWFRSLDLITNMNVTQLFIIMIELSFLEYFNNTWNLKQH